MEQTTDEILMEQLMAVTQGFRRQIAGGEVEHGFGFMGREEMFKEHRRRMEEHERHDSRSRFNRQDGMPEGRRGWVGSRGAEGFGGPQGPGGFGSPWGSPAGAGDGRQGFGGWERRGMTGPSSGRRPPMARERVLRIISEEEGISQRRIAEFLAIRPQSLSELLGKLEKDGYITRSQNEEDKREILVYLTDRGRERAKELEACQAEQAAGLFRGLTEEEKLTLSSLLKKLLDSYLPG